MDARRPTRSVGQGAWLGRLGIYYRKRRHDGLRSHSAEQVHGRELRAQINRGSRAAADRQSSTPVVSRWRARTSASRSTKRWGFGPPHHARGPRRAGTDLVTEAQEKAALKLAETARKRLERPSAAQKEIDKLRPWFRELGRPGHQLLQPADLPASSTAAAPTGRGDIKLLRESRERRIRSVELRKGARRTTSRDGGPGRSLGKVREQLDGVAERWRPTAAIAEQRQREATARAWHRAMPCARSGHLLRPPAPPEPRAPEGARR